MYCTGRNIVSKKNNPGLWGVLDNWAHLANNLGNAALFRLRQNLFMQKKEKLSDLETEVLREIEATMKSSNKKRPGALMSYNFLEKLMRETNNPDFFSGLPMQTAQQILKVGGHSMKSYLASCREYKKDPDKFTGKPAIPKYHKKGGRHSFVITNQDCVIYREEDGSVWLKFPKTNIRLQIESIPKDARLKQVTVCPYYDGYEVLYTYETDSDPQNEDLQYCAGIDFGVNNIAAIVTNEGSSLLVKGGAAKAANQWFNKRRSKLVSAITKGTKNTSPKSRQLDALSKNRTQFFTDLFHQVSARIVRWCLEHKVGTLVLGKTQFWKQNVNIGSRNNQDFVFIPFEKLRNMIEYKAVRAGIRVLFCEESYTSKASFVDGDYIPTYGVDDNKASFSGHRIMRGLYKTKDGTLINADLNGAANILRKAVQNAFEKDTNTDFLKNPVVLSYTCLHESNPVKGIAAV